MLLITIRPLIPKVLFPSDVPEFINSLFSEKDDLSEVSEMVGYRNVNTFIRVFKDLEGISPGEYKRIFTER